MNLSRGGDLLAASSFWIAFSWNSSLSMALLTIRVVFEPPAPIHHVLRRSVYLCLVGCIVQLRVEVEGSRELNFSTHPQHSPRGWPLNWNRIQQQLPRGRGESDHGEAQGLFWGLVLDLGCGDKETC